jgi:hypothetical protein
MTQQTIEIIVSPAGATTVTTKGFAGTLCRDASRFLEQALGKQTDERLTAEFYQQAAAQQHARQRC